MRIIGALLVSTVLVSSASAQALYKIELDHRIDQAELIVEGRVVDQRSFWNDSQTLILTESTIEPYRLFKGKLAGDVVQLVTLGGTVGLQATVVHPALSVTPGDVGVLFMIRDVTNSQRAWKPYASVQGFIRYNENTGTAVDPFDIYLSIQSEVYGRIESRLGQPATVLSEYTPSETERATANKLAPVISSVSPGTTTAGTGSEITITGSGFESYDNGTNSAVFFSNANDGGGGSLPLVGAGKEYINSWTETEIKVKVPTLAGTGKITVQSASQQTGVSAQDLIVDFNRIEVRSQGGTPYPPDLLDKNKAGGYSLAMSTNTSNSGVNFATSAGLAPFESALARWQAATGLNVRNNGGVTASNTVDPRADPDIIMFDNDANPLEPGILGRANIGYSGCLAGDDIIWWMGGVDIVFRRDGTGGINWNFGPGAPAFRSFDFESVAVHELGHVHQLGHIIAPEKVMHFAVTNGEEVRSLDPVSDVAGGRSVLANVGDLSQCGQSPMAPLVGVAAEDEELPNGLRIGDPYPNPFSDQSQILLSIAKEQTVTVTLYDVLGRPIQTVFQGRLMPNRDHRMTIGGSGLTPGVYFVRITGENFSTTRIATRLRDL